MATFYDLASLTKPLVTAPLALECLDLDRDRREQLGFHRAEPLTVRQLLSHSAGLPPWLPFTGEVWGARLQRPMPQVEHGLFRSGRVGTSLYSDLGYALVAQLLEEEQGRSFAELGQALTGLEPSPWNASPVALPDGQDAVAWALAEPELSFPLQDSRLPHDANARAGMRGHAGFGATAEEVRRWLETWRKAYLPYMAVPIAANEEGTPWGLGLHGVTDPQYGNLLEALPGSGAVRVIEDATTHAPPPLPPLDSCSNTHFWMHLAYTGPALFARPQDRTVLCLLVNRLGPDGELLSMEGLKARRCAVLQKVG